MNLRPVPLAVLITALLGGCASSSEPRYAGTATGNYRGVIAPGESVATRNAPLSAFGTPSNIPEPIRAPAIAQPEFATPVDRDALYGYDGQGRQGMASGDPSAAELSFERALEVNPFDAVALNNLAVAKAERGQFYEATGLLERASKLAPDNSEVIANLARLRGYVQSYATAGVEATPASSARYSGTLPPAPPALWSGASYRPVADRSAAPRPLAATPGDYYTSDACRRVTSKKGKVEIVCEPTR